MNTAQNGARQPSAFVEQALARINELTTIAQDITEALGLPEEACFAVLSGMTPILQERLDRIEQRKAAPLGLTDEPPHPDESKSH